MASSIADSAGIKRRAIFAVTGVAYSTGARALATSRFFASGKRMAVSTEHGTFVDA